MDYFGEGGLCYTAMTNDVCEGTSLLCPKANFADWSHHCPPFPISIASVPSFPATWDDECCGEDPTPVSFCDGNEYQTELIAATNPIAMKDFQLSLARESAEYFGYILNHKRNLEVEIVEARNLAGNNSQCFVELDNQKFSTPIASKTTHPTWNTPILMTIRDYNDDCEVEINVKHRGAFKKGSMGKCYIRPADMHEMEVYDQWVQLEKDGSKCSGEIRIRTVLGNPSLDSVVFSLVPKGSFSSNYTINDELGNTLFTIEGRDNFHYLVDRFGTRVFDIRRRNTTRKVFTAEPIFDVYQADTDNILATVSRKITLVKVEFFIDIMGQRVVSQRDKWNNNISLVKEDGSFVSFMKKPTMANKSMSVEIGPRENVPLLLCVTAFLNLEDSQFSD
jgi:uncharacterized protein YxjI